MALEQEYKITDKIVISDVKYFIDQACDRTKQNVEIDKIKEFVETEKGTIYYFGNDMTSSFCLHLLDYGTRLKISASLDLSKLLAALP